MKLRLFNFSIILVLLAVSIVYSQSTSQSKFLEMKNSFILGLEDKGLEIASELLSLPEYSDVREETVFYISELFFISGIGTEDFTYLSRAYTYYLVYNKDYPNSVYTDIVDKRINTLTSYYKGKIDFRNLYDILENEAPIVEKKLSFATKELFIFSYPNIYKYFDYTESEQSSVELLDRYFDEIIINHPEFEVYGYYYKIVARLSKISGLDFVKDGLLEFNVDKITTRSYFAEYVIEEYRPEAKVLKRELEGMLKPLSEKYPHNPLVLNLHLAYANIFMRGSDDKFDFDTKEHLEFVVQNELDKTHHRYLMAKEFLLNNQFIDLK